MRIQICARLAALALMILSIGWGEVGLAVGVGCGAPGIVAKSQEDCNKWDHLWVNGEPGTFVKADCTCRKKTACEKRIDSCKAGKLARSAKYGECMRNAATAYEGKVQNICQSPYGRVAKERCVASEKEIWNNSKQECRKNYGEQKCDKSLCVGGRCDDNSIAACWLE